MNPNLPAHSKLGASSASRWMACPGSVNLSEGLPDTTSKYAEEGTQAHELAAVCLEHDNDAASYARAASLAVDRTGFLVTEEMAEAVQVYLDTVRGDAGDTAPIRLIEHKFDLEELHPGMFGTADCVQVWPGRKFMRVYDYKHGAGVSVAVEGNKQLKYYALGALISYGKPITEVELVIVQPRCSHAGGQVRRHRFKAFELMDFEGDLVKAAKATELPDAKVVAGDHCKWCKAVVKCPEQRRIIQEVAKMEFKPDVAYDPKALSDALALADIAEASIHSIRSFAFAEAERGRCAPGWKLVDKRPARNWNAEDSVIISELVEIGLKEADLYAPLEIKSPAQVEKVIGKSKANADKLQWMGSLTKKVSSGQTLVLESDPRPAAKRSAQEDFANANR